MKAYRGARAVIIGGGPSACSASDLNVLKLPNNDPFDRCTHKGRLVFFKPEKAMAALSEQYSDLPFERLPARPSRENRGQSATFNDCLARIPRNTGQVLTLDTDWRVVAATANAGHLRYRDARAPG